jgi:hypothetical protein
MASLSYPYTIVNGTPADATQVQSNFNSIKSYVESNVVQVDGTVQAGNAAIANDSISAAKIQAVAVEHEKIATNAVWENNIIDAAVSNAKLRSSAALSVMGRSASTSGAVADIAGTAYQVLRVNNAGTTLAFGAINLEQSAAVSGQLGIANGGTGAATAAAGLVALNGYGKGASATAGHRITISSASPTGGANGDIWFKV